MNPVSRVALALVDALMAGEQLLRQHGSKCDCFACEQIAGHVYLLEGLTNTVGGETCEHGSGFPERWSAYLAFRDSPETAPAVAKPEPASVADEPLLIGERRGSWPT